MQTWIQIAKKDKTSQYGGMIAKVKCNFCPSVVVNNGEHKCSEFLLFSMFGFDWVLETILGGYQRGNHDQQFEIPISGLRNWSKLKLDQIQCLEDFHYASPSHVSRGERRSFQFQVWSNSFSRERLHDGNVRNWTTYYTNKKKVCQCFLWQKIHI